MLIFKHCVFSQISDFLIFLIVVRLLSNAKENFFVVILTVIIFCLVKFSKSDKTWKFIKRPKRNTLQEVVERDYERIWCKCPAWLTAEFSFTFQVVDSACLDISLVYLQLLHFHGMELDEIQCYSSSTVFSLVKREKKGGKWR